MEFDKIGYWSELKLEILRKYAQAYSTILSKQPLLSHAYIDGFSGGGVHRSKATGEPVPGSPLNALQINPPFRHYYLVDLDGDKVDHLKQLAGERADVSIFQGDCNEILLRRVFPRLRYEDYRRGLCVLDPYGLHLDWSVLSAAGAARSIEIFLNFPIMDINRNILLRDESKRKPDQLRRMTAFWGDESWRKAAYVPPSQTSLFGEPGAEKLPGNEAITRAFRDRLRDAAGFAHVSEPLPMRNSTGAVVYHLFFASPRPVAREIVDQIFASYRGRR